MILFMDMIDEPSDQEKYCQIYQQYVSDIYRYAFSILHNEIDAEDATQEVFFRVAKKISLFSDVICPQTKNLLVIICKNICLDMWREQKRRNSYTEDPDIVQYMGKSDTDPYTPEKAYLEQEAEQRILQILRNMPERYQEVLDMSLLQGYLHKDIAELTGIKLETVKKRCQRGKKMLQDELKKDELI